MSVDGELAAILRTSRYAPYFTFSPFAADAVPKSKVRKSDYKFPFALPTPPPPPTPSPFHLRIDSNG